MDVREIKFRAWFGGEMHQEIVIVDPNWRGFGCPLNSGIADFQSHDDPESPMVLEQFTGLYDRNGAEIYEGDVVLHRNGEMFTIIYSEHVPWFVFREMDGQGHEYLPSIGDYDELEICGNIHENPELVK